MTLTCKGLVLRELERPAPFAESAPLQLETVTLLPPKATDVVVKVMGGGLCHSDLSVITGNRGRMVPMLMGHEGAGEVVEIGAGIDDVRVGDKVVFQFAPSCGRCEMCQSGRPQICQAAVKARAEGGLLSGGTRIRGADGEEIHHHTGISCFAEYAVVSRGSVVVVDDPIPMVDAAVFGCAVMTGAGAVMNTARLQAGETVAVFGLGGVGLCGIMGARASGAEVVIGVDTVEAKRRKASELGATHVFDAADPELASKVADLTRGGVDVAVELAGAVKALEGAYSVLRRGGRLITAGLSPAGATFGIDHAEMVSNEKAIIGSYMGSSVPVRDIPRFLRMYHAGALPVDRLIDGYLGFDEVNAGFDKLAEGRALRQILAPHGHRGAT
ncbi:putative zinc-type alcohol dehydrogenase transmembrane protein [Pseudooceanicola batsensis HTCC2597]|uniref:Putative zinc-type alcohol dehydrogenase transmembrane protein n=1 Tax=Pseudooceanicola batsensis (strain ATCC BAA-863 / DSM 15984 / KCTC 12145 / HTCC2597) TaxID=252305 RepID=A3TSX8_PSEBH|nr:zinc-binding dehydrogenase [Pseudooceanicola batsensis]EAQ04755.1 putative zinc-type alcohol dehydrogenase transmembrane protein [Pseudooceanicola batsensis HTCC2597]